MLYFAYGSNMDWERITSADRAPSAQFLLRATLPEHALKFTRHSDKQKTGTADVVAQAGSLVWGVVFHIEEADSDKLDSAEGVSSGAYRREPVTVFVENASSRPLLRVRTYVVCRKKSEHQPPAQWYLDHILKGATRWELPEPYVASLRVVQTLTPDEADSAKTLAREIASRAIKNNPHLWDDLKSRLADCQSVDVYGSMNQMDFLDAVKREVANLLDAEQALLQKHILPPPDAPSHITFHDLINGQIFTRAKSAARRM